MESFNLNEYLSIRSAVERLGGGGSGVQSLTAGAGIAIAGTGGNLTITNTSPAPLNIYSRVSLPGGASSSVILYNMGSLPAGTYEWSFQTPVLYANTTTTNARGYISGKGVVVSPQDAFTFTSGLITAVNGAVNWGEVSINVAYRQFFTIQTGTDSGFEGCFIDFWLRYVST